MRKARLKKTKDTVLSLLGPRALAGVLKFFGETLHLHELQEAFIHRTTQILAHKASVYTCRVDIDQLPRLAESPGRSQG